MRPSRCARTAGPCARARTRPGALAAHVLDGVLVTDVVRPLDGVVHVPAPVVVRDRRWRSAQVMPPWADTVCERVGNTLVMTAVFGSPTGPAAARRACRRRRRRRSEREKFVTLVTISIPPPAQSAPRKQQEQSLPRSFHPPGFHQCQYPSAGGGRRPPDDKEAQTASPRGPA
jgi:hypothetical protein